MAHPAGSGKSSILRVLRKLWKPVKGSARLCSDGSHHDIMFLPQKPYLTSGSLADQVYIMITYRMIRMHTQFFCVLEFKSGFQSESNIWYARILSKKTL